MTNSLSLYAGMQGVYTFHFAQCFWRSNSYRSTHFYVCFFISQNKLVFSSVIKLMLLQICFQFFIIRGNKDVTLGVAPCFLTKLSMSLWHKMICHLPEHFNVHLSLGFSVSTEKGKMNFIIMNTSLTLARCVAAFQCKGYGQ